MGKDPAFLFYYTAFADGTKYMTDEEIGIYMRLLCEQADKFFISPKIFNIIIGPRPEAKETILEKFCIDEFGNYYNERLRVEQLKRKKYTDTRVKNFHKNTDMDADMGFDMGNHTKDKDINKDKDVNIIKDELETVLGQWNLFATSHGLATILKLTAKRKTAVLNRKEEKEFDLEKIFTAISKSTFLKGENDRGWKVDFDFIFCSANNYLKIIEGKYNGTAKQSTGASNEFLAKLCTDRAIREQQGK